jgi:hypothetical protein
MGLVAIHIEILALPLSPQLPGTVATTVCAGESIYGRNLARFAPRDTMFVGKPGV